ncbi:hypothetical protein BDR06DRAFT_878339 [Suillus hirtellus]|nr:hypothetical protein BDR06DRAFT_878339 [Suillus hirtellus]
MTPIRDPHTWAIVMDFANEAIQLLSKAEQHLSAYLGSQYSCLQWKPALNKVLKAEDNEAGAGAAITHINTKSTKPSLQAKGQLPLPELNCTESQLMKVVNKLYQHKHIQGTWPTLEDPLDPVEEREIGDLQYCYPGRDTDMIEEVKQNSKVAEDCLSSDGGSDIDDQKMLRSS